MRAAGRACRRSSSPAWYDPLVLTVGSIGQNGQPSNFSMSGPWLGAAAPGENLVALGYEGQPINAPPGEDGPVPLNGTSFSAAFVSGLAALVKQRFPDLTPAQVINRITATARHPGGGVDNYVGAGVVDPVAALDVGGPRGPGEGTVPGQGSSPAGVHPAARPRPDHRCGGRRGRARADPRDRRDDPTRVAAPPMSFLKRHFGFRFTTGHAIWAATLIPACIAVCMHFNLLWLGITLSVLIAIFSVLDDPWISAHRLGQRGLFVAATPPQHPRCAVGARGRSHRDARRSRRRALAGRSSGLGDRVGTKAFHPDGDRQRRCRHRRHRQHQARREADPGALPRPGGRRRVGWLPGRQDRTGQPGRPLRAGGRPVPGAGEPAHLDCAARRSGADPTLGAAPRQRGVRAGPISGGLDHPHRGPVGQQRDRRALLRAASTTTTRPPRSASRKRPGRSSRAAAPSPRPTTPPAARMSGGRRAPTTPRPASGSSPGAAPTTDGACSTTLSNPTTPRGFSCLYGGQRAALQGISPVTDKHYDLPIGSAGVLVGETLGPLPGVHAVRQRRRQHQPRRRRDCSPSSSSAPPRPARW